MPLRRPRRWTVADFERLVDQREGSSPRYELVDGELLVTPAPSGRHQRIILDLAFLLRDYLKREPIGEIRLGPGALELATGERYEPDLFVVPVVGSRRPSAEQKAVCPLLICEVVSPASARHDRITKRRAFQRSEVPEYWIIDADAQAIEVWHPSDECAALVDDRLVWWPEGASSRFELNVRAFFASAADGSPLGA